MKNINNNLFDIKLNLFYLFLFQQNIIIYIFVTHRDIYEQNLKKKNFYYTQINQAFN
jgi:hypothetical protein